MCPKIVIVLRIGNSWIASELFLIIYHLEKGSGWRGWGGGGGGISMDHNLKVN